MSAPAPGAPRTPPSALTLVSAFSLLSLAANALTQGLFFPSSPCYSRGATTVTDGLSLGQRRVCLGAGWHWLCWTRGKLLTASHRNYPCSLPATKTLPHKPSTRAQTRQDQAAASSPEHLSAAPVDVSPSPTRFPYCIGDKNKSILI